MTLKWAALSAAILIATPSFADVDEDLTYIVSQQVNRTMFEGALSAQRPLIVGAIENELRNRGIGVSDLERFLDIFFEEFLAEFTEKMQDQAATLYRATFTDTEITDMATFFRTPSGQAMINAAPVLMAEGAAQGQIAGAAAGQNAMPRVLRRIANEGIEFEAPGVIDRLREELGLQ